MPYDMANHRHITVGWVVRGGAPTCPPDPSYPEGVALDVSSPGAPACDVRLPYPAPCVGTHVIACNLCGLRVAVSAAGRPDDPTSVRMACKQMGLS